MNLKNVLLLIAFVASSNSSAQKITKVVDKEVSFISISAESNTEGYDSICIILRGKTSVRFVENLRIEMSNFSKWYDTAIEHRVTDFSKKLARIYFIDRILFDYEGHSYSAKSKKVDLYFVVDEQGESYLKIQGKFQGGIGTDFFSTSNGIVIGQGQVAVSSSESSLMKRVSFDYSIKISKEQ